MNGATSIHRGPGVMPESIGLHVNGDLWIGGARVINWTQPFQKGDTVGCGIVVGSNAKYFFTRNGETIDCGGVDCRVTSIKNAVMPCVGISSSTDTAIRTNFGFNSDHRFVWKGKDRVRIICHATASSPSSAIDDSIRSDEDFLPTDLVRGHTVSGDTRDGPTVLRPRSQEELLESATTPRRQARRHSERLPLSRHGSKTGDDLFFFHEGLDSDSDSGNNHGDSGNHHGASTTNRRSPLSLSDEMLEMDMDAVVTKTNNLNNDLPALDLNDVKELARELRNATGASDAHHGALSPLIDVCRSNLDQLNDTVQRATMGVDSGHDLGELLSVHEVVTDAIEAAEKKRTDTEPEDKASRKKRDIFSLLCHLRGQKQKRYDAVWGLLR